MLSFHAHKNGKKPPVRLHSLMFPQPPRDFHGQRWVRIALRTAHLISIAVLTGGVSMGAAPLSMAPAFWTTLLTGVLFVGVELFYTGVWLFQLKGIAVMAKILLLGAAAAAPHSALWLLVAAIVIGGVSSHMPGKYRYYSLWHGRVVKE